jgi:hypothetical protein
MEEEKPILIKEAKIQPIPKGVKIGLYLGGCYVAYKLYTKIKLKQEFNELNEKMIKDIKHQATGIAEDIVDNVKGLFKEKHTTTIINNNTSTIQTDYLSNSFN